MSRINVADRNALQEIAERMIGGYVCAVEQNDISSFGNWITEEDHWRFDFEDGMKILKILGFDNASQSLVAQRVREELGEDEEEDEDETMDLSD